MQYWYSPTDILSSLQEKLAKTGLKQLTSVNSDHKAQNVLLIYSAPNQVLEQKRLEESTATTSSDICMYYEKLSSLSAKYKNISSSWRLNMLDTTSIRRLCNDETPQLDKSIKFPSLKPLPSLLTLEIARKEPKIIEIYLDLELKSNLFGLEAESNYLQRLSQGSLIDLALMDWWEVNIDREASFEEVRNSLNQLAQIQSDYESLMEDNKRLQKLLKRQKSKNTLLLEENKELRQSSTNQSISNQPGIQESGAKMSQTKRQLEVTPYDKKSLFPRIALGQLLKPASRKTQ